MEEEIRMEVLGPIVATESTPTEDAIAELDRRIRAMESAIGDLRSVKAQEGSVGRKTMAAFAAKGIEAQAGSVDEALRSLSLEQRIAVKSGLMRAGMLV
ncbi:hypothetical protein Terro_0137 [Terriglobus roseus DSM 18391]|uniref:Uncharacterized protein n=1 Tax=Terriglobus roseus (strain DSM 18391 / NRRL B-41598 / KBS 63) TaxID=926566 RepID=I3ZB70_TERRK|nr:hypothetical protein [Terriglobus roseus]AFL86488.1 hypothetical protein Terro_0137 [Terriglobus roseus DSM 18391]